MGGFVRWAGFRFECGNDGGDGFYHDSENGEVVCCRCGLVQEEVAPWELVGVYV
ncbi:MAG: hypothetical protein ACE5Z5_11095 [Candidatus Bathyarchaeia archaeon]